MMSIALSILSSISMAAATGERCPSMTYQELKQEVQRSGPVRLVFFSSWCASCKDHLEPKSKSRRLLVVTYDEPDRAAKVLKHFRNDEPCVTDNGIARELGVKVVPAEIDFDIK